MNPRILIASVMCAAACLCAVACENENGELVSPVEDSFALTSAPAQALAMSNTIPRRALSYTFGTVTSLPTLKFDNPTDDVVKADLLANAPRLISSSKGAHVLDNGSTFALQLSSGAAWSGKKSGSLALYTLDGVRGPTVLSGATDAVDKALSQIKEKGLLSLGVNESLDVISVTSTHYAAWAENSTGETVPVYFDVGEKVEPVTEYTSEYTVTFGRRYRGVPVVGSMAMATVDSTGRLVAFSKQWRRIAGETGKVAILTEREMRASIDQNLLSGRKIVATHCGYVESPAVGMVQTAPGLGCEYVLSNGTQQEDGEVVSLVNAVSGSSVPLEGKPLDYSKNATVIAGKDVD